MEQKKCTFQFDSTSSQASIYGIDSNPLVINYSGDIDLTPLVQLLSQKIEDESLIELTYSGDEQNQTDKEKILFDTLTKIVDSYNRSFSVPANIDTQKDSDENITDTADLPF